MTGAAAAILCNIFILCIANSDDDVEQVISVVEEKTNGAIMLYWFLVNIPVDEEDLTEFFMYLYHFLYLINLIYYNFK